MRYEYRSYGGKVISIEATGKQQADEILKAFIVEVTQPAPMACREVTPEPMKVVTQDQE